MSSIRFEWEWFMAGEEHGLCGPERSTFATLEIWIDGSCLTSCRSNSKHSEQRHHVIGPLSGLADWLVDHWLEVFWQTHTPFSKTRAGDARVPDYDSVLKSESEQIDIAAYGEWYACHCLGHSASDLALPTLLFIPEDTQVGIAVGPASSLGATCTFSIGPDRAIAWISKADLGAELKRFVDAILDKARQDQETAAWANWLQGRFDAVLTRERDASERRRQMFGNSVVECWPRIEQELGQNSKILNGILVDSELVGTSDELTPLISHVKRLASENISNPLWASIQASPGEAMLPAYERGYRRAERVRCALNLGDDPVEIRDVLESLQIGLKKIDGPAIARSAYMVTESGVAEICLFTSHPRSKDWAPRRFSLASALGGLFASQSLAMPYGGANSDQARWTRSQEAKAYAAMFLLPASSVEANPDLDQLVENYGISRTAAIWHIENLRQRQQRNAAGVL
jgi:hypothetical protein